MANTPNIGPYTELKPFRFWCQKVLPLVYDESLSYYELLCKVVDYLNKTMEDVDQMIIDMGGFQTAYGEFTQTMEDKYTAFTEGINDAVEALENFVNNYFDNLDVQDEIDHKIDEMAEQGYFDELFGRVFSDELIAVTRTTLSQWLYNNIVQETGYVLDKTLTVENAAADAKATGTRIEGIEELLDEFGEFIPSFNIWNPDNTTLNKMCRYTTLVLEDTTSYKVNKCPIEAEETYSYKLGSLNDTPKPRYIVFVDSDGNGLSVIDGTDLTNNVFTTPVGAVEAWLTVPIANTNEMLVKGNYPYNMAMAYTPYGEVFQSKITTDYVNGLKRTGRNLIDPSKMTSGYLNNNIISPSDSYITSDFIPIEANELYSIGPADNGARFVYLYDENKAVLSKIEDNHTYNFTPTVNGYVRVTYYVADTGKCLLVKGNNTAFSEYKKEFGENIALNEWQKNDLADELFISNPLKNKKWCVLGDSFTNGATATTISTGKYKGQKYVYPYLIGNRNNMDIVSFFGGGRTLAYPASHDFANSVCNPNASYYFENIPADSDYITIYLGINDSQHENGISIDQEDVTGIIPLGDITDNDTSTYYGAWNVMLNWLIANRPFAHIGIIVTNGTTRPEYRTAQLDITKKFGIPYIDMNGDNRTPAMIRSQNPDIAAAVKTAITTKQAVDYPSNTHPNDNAHLYESYFIENFLKSI